MGLFKKKSKPKEGAVKTVNGIHYAYRGNKWVKMSAEAQANINRNDALNRANVGGTTQLLKNQKAPSNQSNSSATTNTNNNNNKKEWPKGKPKVLSVGTVDFNVNTPAGLTSYNKALKASKGLKTDKEIDKSTNKVLKEERDSNRNKISANKKSDKPSSNIHTRHFQTGERLGVMTRSQRRNYDKLANGRTFEGQVAKHEKDSGHGKSHLRETKYKASVRRGETNNSSSNKGSSTSNNGSTNRTKLKGKSAYDMKLKTKLTDSKVYGKKKKKKQNNNLTKDEIKYPTRGTFRGI